MKQFGYLVAFALGAGAFGLLAFGGILPFGTNASAQQSVVRAVPKGQGFDFYVLALSWSPTYCQDTRAKSRDTQQCSGARPYAFVVHGLWPQFERGYPKACRTRFDRPSRAFSASMLDIMPSDRLVQHEWEQHGSCSGLSATQYYEVTRAAYEAVTIPDEFASVTDWRRVSAGDVEAAFVRANPGFSTGGIGVEKRGNLLSEVRVCLTLDLKPRSCLEVDQDGIAPNTRVSMPPSRG